MALFERSFLITTGVTAVICGVIFYYFNTRVRELELALAKQSQVLASFIANVQQEFRVNSARSTLASAEANQFVANMASANMASANMASANMAIANQIYILIAQLQDKYPYRLNKAVLVKKILHKNKLATDNAEEYIKELLY